MSAVTAAPTRSPAPAVRYGRRMAALVVLIPALVGLALWAFAWPAARTAPHDLPLGVAGPGAAVAKVEGQLTRHEGAFEIHRYADEAAARDAIENRTVYGAVVVTPRGPELLTASAASPLVAQVLQQAVAHQAPGGTTARVRTVDVVAAPRTDPRGSALGASVLPMAMVGIGAGVAVTLLGLRGIRAVTALVGATALVGMVAAGIADSWLGVITGDWWAEAGALGLSALAVSGAVAGMAALIGQRGIAVVSLVVMLLGNPFSGASSAPQMLPEPVGVIGQWLPPGAGASLLRSVAFFDGAAATGPALTLVWWAAIGLGLVLLGGMLSRRRGASTLPAAEEPVPAFAG
ncbi:ABC transporter permease [Streptomyces sp. NPDC047022]|uniref:ABC transporter permease n=1 Tax=Streptomyces sp. NPDC047022 TaxID=3155737 RepID=UPI0033DA7901